MEKLENSEMESLIRSISMDLFKQKDAFQLYGLILMGSFSACPDSTKVGSDIDLLILTPISDTDKVKLVEKTVFDLFRKESVILILKVDSSKVIAYTRSELSQRLIKLDIHFAKTLGDHSRYLRGSEKCSVLWTVESVIKEVDLTNLMATKAFEILPDYQPEFHINRFLECYELLCKNILIKDSYRVEFYGWIIRHSLVVLERISLGEKTHLYLPKRAFDAGEVRNLPNITDAELCRSAQIWQIVDEYGKLFCRICRNLNIGLDVVNSYQGYLNTTVSFYIGN